ncbi:hypothetical protein ACFWPX_01815 [Nocardia sp. NPDC058518]|uniref:hypothetical protein n=1 Tax=Nocardia sp. NPDC058518 TaxID=3346534 RepID=UPI0036542D50
MTRTKPPSKDISPLDLRHLVSNQLGLNTSQRFAAGKPVDIAGRDDRPPAHERRHRIRVRRTPDAVRGAVSAL